MIKKTAKNQKIKIIFLVLIKLIEINSDKLPKRSAITSLISPAAGGGEW